jgi:putative DNA primase/helicase
MKEATIKTLTGGEAILVRRMMQEFVEVNPEFKLTISGNHRPEIRGGDDGIWRRMLLVPFDVQIPEADVDKLLGKKLWAERSGILNWLLDGTRKWLESGLMIPAEISDATTAYRDENDLPLAFLKTCCEVTGEKDDFIRARDLNETFNFWLSNKGEREWGSRTISNKFIYKAKFFTSADGKKFGHDKSNNTGYRGLKITQEFLDLKAESEQEARGFGGAASPPDVY